MKILRVATLPLLLSAACAARAQTAEIEVNDGTAGFCYGAVTSGSCGFFNAPTIDTLVADGAGKSSEIMTTADATSILTDNSGTWSSLNVGSAGTALESSANAGYAAAGTQTGTSTITGLESGQFVATGENSSNQDSSIVLEGTTGFLRTRDASTNNFSFYQTDLSGTTMGYAENGTAVATISSNAGGHQIVGNTSLTGTLAVSEVSMLNGVDNQGAGVTNAGLVSGVTAGTVAAGSTEAVNGSQLFVTNTAVAAAQSTADSALSNAVAAQVTADTALTSAATAQTTATTAMTRSSTAMSVANTANANALSAYSMASGLNGRISSLEGSVGQLSADLKHVDRMAGRGIAIATALASMPDLEPGKTAGIGIGTGSYDGHNAVSAAFVVRASENLKLRLNGGSAGGGKFAFGAGGMFSW